MYQNPSWWYKDQPLDSYHFLISICLFHNDQKNFQGSVRCIWQYSSSYIYHILCTIYLQTASSYQRNLELYHFEIHLAYAKIYSVLETYILHRKDSSRIIDLWGVPLIYAWIRTISLTWYARNPKYPQDEVTLYTLSCCTLVYQASPGTDQTIQQMCQQATHLLISFILTILSIFKHISKIPRLCRQMSYTSKYMDDDDSTSSYE